LGDRQSSHPVKTLLQCYGKSLEALPGVAYPGFRDNRSTLNTKTGFLKNCMYIWKTLVKKPEDFGEVGYVVLTKIITPVKWLRMMPRLGLQI